VTDAAGKVLKLLNLPKDAVHWPIKDQVVDILPWYLRGVINSAHTAASTPFPGSPRRCNRVVDINLSGSRQRKSLQR
jgi:hypothetical protein